MALAAALLLALLLAPWPVLAAEPACPPRAGVPTQEQIRVAMRGARDRGALWRFSKDGRDGHLYGTIHVGKLDWAMPGRAVFGALHEAETVVLEADPLDTTFHAGVTAPPAPHEAPPLPARLARRLREQAGRTCASWERLRTMPPMMIATTLTLLDAAWAGFHAEYASEMVLAGYARGSGKPLTALENSTIQRAAINGGRSAEQLASIETLLTAVETGTARKEVAAVAEAWARGDLDELRRSLSDVHPADRASLERLIAPRNPAMAARIEALHAGGQRLFVAVGIMHMVGDAALPALLRERGFTVERVAFDGHIGLQVEGEGFEGNPARVPLPKE